MNLIQEILFAFSKSPIQKYRESKKFDVDNDYSHDISKRIKIGDMNRSLGVMSSLSRNNILIYREKIYHDK